jgi:hypothetical protein
LIAHSLTNIAGNIDGVLRKHGVISARRDDPQTPNGSCHSWDLKTGAGVEVRLQLFDDSFHMFANACEVRIDRTEDAQPWEKVCLAATAALVAYPLRLRTRRTLFGGRTGAIFLDGPDRGWSGELLAVLGVGREETFTEWLSRAESPRL